MRNLIAALLVTVALVAVIYFAVPRGSMAEPEPVDVPAAAAQATAELGHEVLVPAAPEGWRANSARVEGGVWRVVYAPPTGFVRVSQSFDAEDTWPATVLGGYAPSGSETIAGIDWDVYELPGSTATGNIAFALATRAGDDIILVSASTGGSANARTAAEAVAGQVRTLQQEDR